MSCPNPYDGGRSRAPGSCRLSRRRPSEDRKYAQQATRGRRLDGDFIPLGRRFGRCGGHRGCLVHSPPPPKGAAQRPQDNGPGSQPASMRVLGFHRPQDHLRIGFRDGQFADQRLEEGLFVVPDMMIGEHEIAAMGEQRQGDIRLFLLQAGAGVDDKIIDFVFCEPGLDLLLEGGDLVGL